MTVRIFRPRMACVLEVPLIARPNASVEEKAATPTVKLPVRPIRARFEGNDHNQADELELTLDWSEAGIDPRLLSAATVSFWLGQADQFGRFEPTDENLRFVGIVNDVVRELSESSKRVTLRAQDYTTLFLQCKPFLEEGVPNYTMSLREAWALICDWTGYYDPDEERVTSSVSAIRDRLVGRGNFDPDSLGPMGASLPSRFAKLAKVQKKPGTDAWAVWQQCVGSLGLISYIRGQNCVVTDAASYYSAENTPRFVWGHNISHMREVRDTRRGGKRMALTSYDPSTHTTLEAYWPPRDYGLRTIKKPQASRRRTTDASLAPVTEYEFFTYPYGVSDLETLTRCAQRAWEERSRQELTGTLRTRDMVVGSELSDEDQIDVLTIGAGDIIRVEVDPEARQVLPYLQDARTRAAWLVERRGYEPEVASLMAQNFDELGNVEPEFSVQRVALEYDLDGDGSFDFELSYCSRIQDTEAI